MSRIIILEVPDKYEITSRKFVKDIQEKYSSLLMIWIKPFNNIKTGMMMTFWCLVKLK